MILYKHPLLRKYIFRELLKSFFLTFVILTLLVFIVSTMLLMRKYGQYLGFLDLLSLFPHLLGSSSSLTLPMALLPAVTLTYGRMAHEREILILNVGGYHTLHYFTPAIVFGLICCFFCAYLNSFLVPETHARKREITYSAIDLVISATFSKEQTSIDFIQDLRVFYEEIRHGKLQNLIIQKIKESEVTEEILAKTGELVYDSKNHSLSFKLDHGSIIHIQRAGEGLPQQQRITFRHLNLPIELPEWSPYNRDRAKYKNSFLVRKIYKQKRKELRKKEALLQSNPHDNSLQAERKVLLDDLNTYEVEFHRRLAASFAPLIIALLGAPLGILVRHGNKLVAFGVSAIPIILVYYPLMMWGETIGKKGTLSPFMATWMCNFVAGFIGISLWTRLYWMNISHWAKNLSEKLKKRKNIISLGDGEGDE